MKAITALFALAGLLVLSTQVRADISPKQNEILEDLIAHYAGKAKEEAKNKARNPDSGRPFTSEAGREFYLKQRSQQLTDVSCSACHTDNPVNQGKHVLTNKPIKPLAPSVNPERFIDAKKVQNNFTEHCFDLYQADCRAYEKGIFLTYLRSAK
ncbi:MAG: DUF1924 domain-containing protein [Rhodocyclaceae bacterium]|nr:DUF1924 domain-containing protein [Rhodocyclaceae bacterium]MDZ4216022.1 DUF1924 domain-containing protein [Rhodocyclaceae bacterium]